ncbi:MAG: PEP-CTERM sorting domain-containing protein, partial [Betaproteobacteria bacterium]
PREYDLLLVITQGTFSNADSLGFLVSDFSFTQLGMVGGAFNASFPASDTSNNPVRGLALFARALTSGGGGGGLVPEPASIPLLLVAGVAFVVVAARGSRTRIGA